MEDAMPFTHEADIKLAQHAFRLIAESIQPGVNPDAVQLHALRLVALLVRHRRLRLEEPGIEELNRLLRERHLDAFLIPATPPAGQLTFFDGLDDGMVDASAVPPPVAAAQAWFASVKSWNPFRK
jgi:hypothetical protein